MMVTDTVDTIPLSTNNGSTGYKIKKLQTIQQDPGTSTEHVVKIYSIPQTVSSVDDKIDFSDNTLLAVAYLHSGPAASSSTVANEVIIFDNMTFNQDIYVCHENSHGDNGPVNYYIELEQIKLDLNENTVATLKDIRNIEAQ